MKKSFRKYISISIIAASLSLISCHAPVFESILNEIPLEKNGIGGDITSIIKHGDNIYLTNGIVYKRPLKASGSLLEGNENWERVTANTSFKSDRISYIAGGDKLYGISTSWNIEDGKNTDTDGRTLCYLDGNTWKVVGDAPANITPVLVFCNEEGTKAYVRMSDGSVYSLENGKCSTTSVASNCSSTDGTKFYKGTTAHTLDSWVLYLNEEEDVLYYDIGSETHKISPNVGLLTDFEVTGDTVIIGTKSSGLFHVSKSEIVSKIPGNTDFSVTAKPFSNNAKTIFISSYVVSKLFVADRSLSEDNTVIFAGLGLLGLPGTGQGLFQHKGLYAYYPSRGTWNRDGTNDDSTKGN